MNHASLFSGIGGFDLAAEWMGWNNVFNCEWEEFPRQVLKHHFPNAIQHGDIKELDATTYFGRIDILTGGFPCQPYSLAGKRKGKEDERHLWPEMLRVIRECAPRYVVGENVYGLVAWNGGMVFEEVCSDLETEGYAVQSYILPAASVGAPHRRDRVFFVAADTERLRLEHGTQPRNLRSVQKEESGARSKLTNATQADGDEPNASNTNITSAKHQISTGRNLSTSNDLIASNADLPRRKDEGEQPKPTTQDERTCNSCGRWDKFPTFSPICGGDDGIPRVLDGITFSKWRRESIKAYGNAIVPQVALQIFKAIQQYENGTEL